MNKVVAVLIAAMFLSFCFIPERSVARSLGQAQPSLKKKLLGRPAYVDGEVLVKLKPGVSGLVGPDRLMREIMPLGEPSTEPLNTDNIGDLFLIHIGTGASVESAIAQ